MATRTRKPDTRLAVLDSSVRRPASTSATGRSSRSPLLRRAVVIGLVVLSLVLITISFRESSSGPVHRRAEHRRRGHEAVRGRREPRRPAVPRRLQLVRRPRHGAKREQASSSERSSGCASSTPSAQTAQNENASLKRLLHYQSGPSFPKDFRAVNASVLARGSADVQHADHDLRRLEAGRPRGRSGRHERRPGRQGHASRAGRWRG